MNPKLKRFPRLPQPIRSGCEKRRDSSLLHFHRFLRGWRRQDDALPKSGCQRQLRHRCVHLRGRARTDAHPRAFPRAMQRHGVADAAPARDGSTGILYRVIGYEDRMPLLYAAADLFVTRGGAGTIAELATVGAPAIVVPWPGAAENHQVDNARVLSDRNAAVLIEQADLTVDRLVAEIESFHAHPDRLHELATQAHAEGELHRSGALVGVVERVARA